MASQIQNFNKICIIPGVGTIIGAYVITSNLTKTIVDISKIIFINFAINYYSARKLLDKKFQRQEHLQKVKNELAQHINSIGIGLLISVPVVGGFILYSHDMYHQRKLAQLQAETQQIMIDRQKHQNLINDKIEKLKLAADQGNIPAAVELGDLYFEGKGVEKSNETAFKYFLTSSQKGHIGAMLRLIHLYRNRLGVGSISEIELNYNIQAWEYELCKKRYLETQNKLLIFLKAEIDKAENNLDEKLKWYQLGVQKKFLEFYFPLAELLNSQQKYSEALQYYIFAAERGNINAMIAAANLFTKGVGIDKSDPNAVAKSYTEALKYYTLAAERGNINAMIVAADLLKQGVGINKSDPNAVAKAYSKAYNWYLRAAKLNSTLAQYKVGICYIDGIGIPKDASVGFQCCLSAANKGLLDAKNQIVNILNVKNNKTQSDYQEMLKWSESIIADKDASEKMQQHYIGFIYNLGLFCENQITYDPKLIGNNPEWIELAMKYYQAIQGKRPEAASALNRIYFKAIVA